MVEKGDFVAKLLSKAVIYHLIVKDEAVEHLVHFVTDHIEILLLLID
jgi:hypothetical protein